MSRPTGVFKTYNEYQRLIKNYDNIPKAVLAAVLVSKILLSNGGNFDAVDRDIAEEWKTLYEAGVVPQKPLKL